MPRGYKIYETDFHGGPADGRHHRMIGNPTFWDVRVHRQAVGVVQVGKSAYGGYSDEFWEHHVYVRRGESTDYDWQGET